MAQRFVIVSPDQELTDQLCEALGESGISAEPTVVSEYPPLNRIRRLVESSPDPVIAVIVGLTEQARAVRLIEDFATTHPDILTIAADTASSADKILAAMRAGAAEFLAPPFEFDHLLKRFAQQRRIAAPAASAGRLVCFMPAQGGNGASTVALHVADAVRRQLAKRKDRNGDEKRKILLVDFDFHSGTVAFRLGLKPEFTLADAAAHTEIIDELWDRLASSWKGMDVLPAPPPGTLLPRERIERISTIFTSATRVYPYVVVDLPTALYSSCRDLLISADVVYLVCTPEVMSLHLARRRVNELVDLGLSRESIQLVLNRVGTKRTLKIDVEDVVGLPISWALDNDYSAVNEAYVKGGLIRSDSELGRQLGELASRIMGSGAEQDSKSGAPKRRWRSFLSFD